MIFKNLRMRIQSDLKKMAGCSDEGSCMYKPQRSTRHWVLT